MGKGNTTRVRTNVERRGIWCRVCVLLRGILTSPCHRRAKETIQNLAGQENAANVE